MGYLESATERYQDYKRRFINARLNMEVDVANRTYVYLNAIHSLLSAMVDSGYDDEKAREMLDKLLGYVKDDIERAESPRVVS